MRDLSILLVHLGATLAQLTGPNATPADDEGNRVIDGSSRPLFVNLTVPDLVLPIRALQLLEHVAQLLDLRAVQSPVALAPSLEGS